MTAVCHAPVALRVCEVAALERVVVLKEEDARVSNSEACGCGDQLAVFSARHIRHVDGQPGAINARPESRVGAVRRLFALIAQPPEHKTRLRPSG